MSRFPFVKYQGAGNDFVLIDLSHSLPSLDWADLARRLCERRHGIGADGLLLLLPSKIADYRMSIFNADGSEPAMCGNGIRCLADYIFKRNPALQEVSIETMNRVLKCRMDAGGIAVDLAAPSILHWPIELDREAVYVVDTGVPHAVIFVQALDQVAVESQGRKIRFDSRFAPHGVNVNFAFVGSDGTLFLRTYERGVEGETLACGTGAAAAAFVAMKIHHLGQTVQVSTRSSLESATAEYRPLLRFNFFASAQGEHAIEMIGGAKQVFEGAVDPESL